MTRKNKIKNKIKNKQKQKQKHKLFLDMSYGRKLNLRCFVSKSLHSDAHAVYLEIDRGRERTFRLISAHAKVIDAWKIVVNGVELLETFKASNSQTNDAITQAFIHQLVATYGDYSSDDAEYKPINGAILILGNRRLMEGGSINDKQLPEGISFEPIKPPVTQKWKIYHRECNHLDYPDYPHGMYAIGLSEMEALRIENTENIIISNVYLIAAFIADFLNENNPSEFYLSQLQVDQLFADAEKTFSTELTASETLFSC
ncbi:hypothetical protein [Microcoleus sp. N9_A1]|uniref:hypothetical protein n=1 Tax=Microcoleus sp. N9_A1 TaxID=3055380 RepID=UPI002FD46812